MYIIVHFVVRVEIVISVIMAQSSLLSDVDECSRQLDICNEDGRGIGSCVNTFGSYYCKCITGYKVPPGERNCKGRG